MIGVAETEVAFEWLDEQVRTVSKVGAYELIFFCVEDVPSKFPCVVVLL